MTRVSVLAAFGFTMADTVAGSGVSVSYTDITQFVDMASSGISITRGAQDELSEIQAGAMSLTLDNSDGRFTPALATSPYYPNVKKNVPISVIAVSAVKNLLAASVDFESGVTGWTSSGTPTIAQSATHAQSGSNSMLITWGAVTGQSVTARDSYALYGLTIGQQYTISAYVWVPTGDITVRLRESTTSTNGTANTTFDAFQRLTVTFTATQSVAVVVIQPTATPTAGDQVWVDAVQVEEGASATAFDSAGAVNHFRYFGMVNEWPVRWEGLHSKVSITCSDIFKRLARTPELRPMLIQEVLLDEPLAYYPLAEPEDSTSAGDESGVVGPSALTIQQAGSGGTLTFGQDAGPDDSLGAPVFTPVSASAGKYLSGTLGQTFRDASSSNYIHVECWFSTSTSSSNRAIVSVKADIGSYLLLFYLADTTGYLTVQSRTPGSGGIVTTTVGATNLADGNTHHLLYDEETKVVYVDGVSLGTFSAILGMADLQNLYIGGTSDGTNLWSGTIAHVALYASTSLASSALTTHYTTGTTVHSGETAAQRVNRLASYVGLLSTASGSTFDPVEKQTALGRSPLDHLREIETTEAGKIIQARGSSDLIFQSRDLRYNPASSFSLAYADLETGDVELADDDQKLINTVVGSRPGGATQRVKNAASVTANGPYQSPDLELFKTTDNKVTDAINWMLSKYADPPPELRQAAIEAWSMGNATYRNILNADVSTSFTVTSMPAEAPSSTLTLTIEGYTETIRHNHHTVSFHTSRTNTDAVWVLNDSTYSVLGTTTRLGY